MTEPEDRIAKLQQLLDRVLTRGEPEPDEPAEDPIADEPTLLSEGASRDLATPLVPAQELNALTTAKTPPPLPPDEPPAPPPPLESRSRLVSASEAEELSEDDLMPASEGPEALEAAMPLVRRSKRPSEQKVRAAPPAEPVSGEATLEVDSVDGVDATLAAEIAAEEVHSSEIEAEEVHSSELEEAPVSSRRPISSEDAAPPESGKHMATSAFAEESTTTRHSVPHIPPNVIRADVAESGPIASFVGAVPKAETFGELLDATLEL